MRVQNTQEQKQIYNVFLRLLFLVGNFTLGVIFSTWYFIFPNKLSSKKRPKTYKILDFIVFQWPKDFSSQPS